MLLVEIKLQSRQSFERGSLVAANLEISFDQTQQGPNLPSMYESIPETGGDSPAPAPRNRADAKTSVSIASKILTWEWRVFLWLFFVGCIFFGIYVAGFYWRTLYVHNFAAWDLAEPGLYHPERDDSNYALAIHLVGAGYAMLLGPLQYVPAIRRRWISFHRWNGRILTLLLVTTALGGLYVVWSVGLVFAPVVGQRLNNQNYLFGLCTLVCTAGLYYHAAITKNIDMHKRWAYRLAGVMFGNIYVRLYLLLFFIFWPDEAEEEEHKGFVTVLTYTFFIPQLLLADWIWTLQKKDAQEGLSLPTESAKKETGNGVNSCTSSTTKLLGGEERIGTSIPPKRLRINYMLTSSGKIIWTVAATMLLLFLLVVVTLQVWFVWLPFSFANIQTSESDGARNFGSHSLGSR